jgi:hypothetical protein
MTTDLEVVTAMLRYGGSFAQALARCWQAADPINQQRIRVAFADIWLQYGELVERARRAT